MFTYLEGADRVAGQMRGDKECPFSGVTKSSRVWRKVPESDARSVGQSVLGVCSTFQQAERVSEKTCTVTVGTLRTRHDL